MTVELIIEAQESGAGEPTWRWAELDAITGALTDTGSGTADRLPAPHEALEKITLVVDGTRVTSLKDTLPVRSDAQARKTAPYVLEDRLADAPEDAHVAVGPLDGDSRALAVANRAWLQTLIQSLEAAGLAPQAVYADHMMFAAETPGEPRIDILDDSTFLCRSDGVAARVETALAPLLAPTFFKSEENPLVARGLTPMVQNAFDASGVAYQSVTDTAAKPDLARWARSARHTHLLNLRQGALAPRRNWRALLGPWKRSAALLAATGLTLIGALFFEAQSLHSRARSIDARAKAAMQNAFPDVRNASHMEARLRSLQATSSDRFLVLSAVLFEAVQTVEGVRLVSLRYDENRSGLSVSLTAANFQKIQDIGRAVRERDGSLVEGTSRQSGGQILADVTIDLGGGR